MRRARVIGFWLAAVVGCSADADKGGSTHAVDSGVGRADAARDSSSSTTDASVPETFADALPEVDAGTKPDVGDDSPDLPDTTVPPPDAATSGYSGCKVSSDVCYDNPVASLKTCSKDAAWCALFSGSTWYPDGCPRAGSCGGCKVMSCTTHEIIWWYGSTYCAGDPAKTCTSSLGGTWVAP
jgi:hypothetical protein